MNVSETLPLCRLSLFNVSAEFMNYRGQINEDFVNYTGTYDV